MSKRTVLITGCSDGGLGSALAIALHKEGWRVFASARTVSKMSEVEAAGIERVQLDVTSPDSMKAAVAEVGELAGGSLDSLVHNAGMMYSMPIVDLELDGVRTLFETNTFSIVSVTIAFLPLLLKSTHNSGAMIVCNSSIVAIRGLPFQNAYNASKAAASSIIQGLRLELAPFRIQVVEIITGSVNSQLFNNGATKVLPSNSIYAAAKEDVEKVMKFEAQNDGAPSSQQWAEKVATQLSMANPPIRIWEGKNSWLTKIISVFPLTWFDRLYRSMGAVDIVEQKLQHATESSKTK